MQDAGFRAIELTQAYAQVDRYPAGSPMTRAGCYLTSPAVVDDVRATIAAAQPDALLIDAMFPAALEAASQYELPSAAFFHHFLFRLRDEWRATDARLRGMRERAGFSPLPPLEQLWKRHDRIVVTALAQFDTPADPQWTSVRHVGPVLEDEKCAVPITLPWDANPGTPLVLVSFSTAPEQRSLEKLQRSLDALADLPVHAVATTGDVVEPEELSLAQNAIAVRYAAHDPILQRATLLITHGGHGTLMRSLKYGVPAIVLPGMAHDQAPNGRLIQGLGAGIALPGDADTAAIRAAAETILSSKSYTENARHIASALAGVDGASTAAGEIELLLDTATVTIGGFRA